ncbi:MAG: tetratricopeptide repeat protein [Bacteroidia bacterium]
MHKSRTYLILVFALLASFYIKAGENDTLTSALVEARSYELYTQKSWPELSAFCETAIRNGFDYYYLRMRAGISYYERGMYRKAIGHFKTALTFNTNDETANEYLYYSYIYSGQYEEGRRFSKTFDSAFATRIGTKRLSPVAYCFAEGGVKLTDNPLFDPAGYTSIGLGHYLGGRASLMHAATFYSQNESRFSTRQYQYYIRATIPMKNGFKLATGFHYSYNESSYTNRYVTKITATKLPPPPSNPPAPPGSGPTVSDTTFATQTGKTFINTYVGAVTLTKQTPFIDFWVGGTLASMDTVVHSQVNAGLSVYPLGNNKLSLGATVYYHSNSYFKSSNVAVVPSLNIALSKKSVLALSYLTNSGYNTFEQTGYGLNNSPDLSRSRFSMSLSYQLYKHVQVFGIYCYEEKRDAARAFYYYYNTLIAGIKIIP